MLYFVLLNLKIFGKDLFAAYKEFDEYTLYLPISKV